MAIDGEKAAPAGLFWRVGRAEDDIRELQGRLTDHETRQESRLDCIERKLDSIIGGIRVVKWGVGLVVGGGLALVLKSIFGLG